MTRTGVVAVSGNPRPGSRTSLVARTLAEHLADRLGLIEPVTALDLADVAAELFAETAPNADRYRVTVAEAALAVVATPVYKASYTGLLKAFFDRFPNGGLRNVIAIPVVVSASPATRSWPSTCCDRCSSSSGPPSRCAPSPSRNGSSMSSTR